MATDITRRLGYGGSATIAGVQVLITSGQLDENLNPSYLEPLDLPPNYASGNRSRIRHADGTLSYSGSVSFDVTEPFLAVLTTTTLLHRFYSFGMAINDGNTGFNLSGCNLTSLSLSGDPAGLITATVGGMSLTGISSGGGSNAYIFDDVPLGYWWSGNTAVRNWSFSMSQDVTPVYSNQNIMTPRYLKVGLVSYTLDVTTYTTANLDTINIATKTFTLTGDTTGYGYIYGGQTDLGTYSHTFETAAVASAGSSGIIIV
jgi:hypothetical protein